MRVQNVNNDVANMKTGMSQSADATTKNLQSQILAKQQELKKLSENQDMTMEAKMKKRQEINQQIADLNRQLRQHEIEQRKEKQKEEASMNDMLGGEPANNAASAQQSQTNSGLSDANMKAMISADASMKMSDVQGSVSASLERIATVLRGEIKQDAGRGVSVDRKEQELADIEQRALNAAKGQMKELKGAHDSVKDARKDAIKEARKDKLNNPNKNLDKSDNTSNAFTSNTSVIFKEKDASVTLTSTGNSNNFNNKVNDGGINIIV